MAQIKKIVKPCDLIRGAKVGVAGLDKDGNVIGTGIDAEDIATFPEGAQSGDVLAWGGETGPEWRPHYPESGSEGDVLTLGETGPEWAPPASGGSLYLHIIHMTTNDVNVPAYFSLLSKSSTPFTITSLKTYLTDKGFTSQMNMLSCGVTANVYTFDPTETHATTYSAVSLFIASNGEITVRHLMTGDLVTSGIKTVNSTAASTLTDTVIEL